VRIHLKGIEIIENQEPGERYLIFTKCLYYSKQKDFSLATRFKKGFVNRGYKVGGSFVSEFWAVMQDYWGKVKRKLTIRLKEKFIR